MLELIGRLLSELHSSNAPYTCPGDWAWATTVCGAVFGLLPVIGAMVVAAIRHATGNRYEAAPLLVFSTIGFLLVGALPLWAFSATSEVFRGAARGAPVGLDDQTGTLPLAFCPDQVPQVTYLGDAVSVRAAIGDLSGSGIRAVITGLVAVVAPLLALLFVYLQARAAFRRGPKWPARLFWLPVLLLAFGTAPLSVSVVAHLWLGFVPVAMVGIIGVLLVGAPSWNVINSAGRRDRSRDRSSAGYPAPGGYPGQAPQPGWSQQQPQVPPYQPPPPWPARSMPPTLVSHGNPAPGPSGISPGAQHGQPLAHTTPASAADRLRLNAERAAADAATDRAVAPRLAAEPGPLPATLQQAIAAAKADLAAESEDDGGVEQTAMLPSSRFQRIRRLGSGGFGQVWLAMDTKLARTVAVKVATAHSAETEQRIQREARALAAVHHPNCVRIYDIVDDLDGGGLAIVMEYVPGRPLGEVVAEGRLNDAGAARLWYTLAGALLAAHAKGVLHRDVKPSNIIIADDGAPRLIDFGIARAAGDVTLTAAGLVVGTPDFLPPEIASGRPPGPASDAWQLAAVVSFALTGVPPRGHSDGAVAAMLAAARGEPCNQLPAATAHRKLLERSLDANPSVRPTLPAVQAELAGWVR